MSRRSSATNSVIKIGQTSYFLLILEKAIGMMVLNTNAEDGSEVSVDDLKAANV